MYSLVLGTLFELGFTETAIRVANKWKDESTGKKHDAAKRALEHFVPLYAYAQSSKPRRIVGRL